MQHLKMARMCAGASLSRLVILVVGCDVDDVGGGDVDAWRVLFFNEHKNV